ncbi:MAG TPA: glycosyltransferase family 4 protein [Solirubrobacteraceae bacterium]|nr:glycosyltransferase family 4 protein [Solirubrobacteraceae bacterium]
MNVHQILSGAGPVDAVTSQARTMRRLMRDWGWGGVDVASSIDPRMGRAVRPLRALNPARSDVLLVHYSAYAPKLERFLELPNPKLLISHNVTPARWFWDVDPHLAIHCSLGRQRLPRFVQAVDLAAGVSAFNAAELRQAGARETTVIPIHFDPARLGACGPDRDPDPDHPPVILFVGRLTPHKRQDELIRAFALFRRHRSPQARLELVGEPVNEDYGAALAALAEELAPGAVRFGRGLSDEALADRYRSAHVLCCLSEHEGFCIPLLEAFHFGVPVVARPAGGVPEVAGDAALLVPDRDPAVVAELLELAAGDAELRADLRTRGRARVAAYDPGATARALRAAVERVAAARNGCA